MTSEFVPRVRRDEWIELHTKASKLYEMGVRQKHVLFIPSVVLIELGAVIAGLTREEETARKVVEHVKEVAWIIYDDPLFTEHAIKYGIAFKLSGFDTTIATCALLNSANLITNDRKFYEKFAPQTEDYGLKVYLLRQLSMNELETLE